MTDRELMQMALDALEKIEMGGDPRWASDVTPALHARLAQPEREWQGLTEDEVAQAMYRADAIVTGPMQFKFAKEIEAKLKEKNT